MSVWYLFAFSGHFLLTNLLADVLFAGKPSRVINVSSRSYQFSSIDFDDINLEKYFGPFRANFRSQLCNVLFSNELARRTKGGLLSLNYACHVRVLLLNKYCGFA
jgi:hypothetical protein